MKTEKETGKLGEERDKNTGKIPSLSEVCSRKLLALPQARCILQDSACDKNLSELLNSVTAQPLQYSVVCLRQAENESSSNEKHTPEHTPSAKQSPINTQTCVHKL